MFSNKYARLPLFGIVLMAASAPLEAQSAVQVEIQGNQVAVGLDLGTYQATLQIVFEQVVGLDASSLDVEVSLLNPVDPGLLNRLPSPTLTGLVEGFPLILNISPTAQSALSFTGVVTVELSTENLQFHPAFRLFKAPSGGTFEDITDFSGIGSYRVRGTTGEFSDFIIAADVRDPASVVAHKLSRLQAILDAAASKLPNSLLESLGGLLDSAAANLNQGAKSAAIAALEEFEDQVRQNQGSIPAVYRANDTGTQNIAGALRSQVRTLIFSIKVS